MTESVYFTNGTIYPMEREGEIFSGMLVSGGKIQALYRPGEDSPPPSARRVVDLGGKTVLPGFTDSHSHFLSSAVLHGVGCSISEVKDGRLAPDTVAGAVEKLARFATGVKNRKSPVIGFNYIVPSMAEDRLPLKDELDTALPGRRVIVMGMDAHSSSYSTPALMALGIDPEGHNGILTGEDHDMHVGQITGLVMKSLSVFDILKAIQDFTFASAARGLTCIHCLEGSEDKPNNLSLRLLALAARVLPVRLRLFIQYKSTDAVRPFLKYLSYPRLGGCSSWEMDGSVGSRSAAFDEPFAGTEDNRGLCYYSQEEILPYVEQAHREGFQLTVHAIGPRGIETILSAFEQVMKDENGGSNPRRHRIDHFEFPRPDQVKRAVKDLGLIITAQPGYSWMDEHFQKAYRRYLTPKQFESQIPMKTIAEMGGIICGSSDSPVQENDPFLQIQGMVDFPIPAQRLSMFQAVRTYTANGAYSTFAEESRGTLAPGKQADFIILSEDPFSLPADRIAGLKPEQTWIAGSPVIRRILPAWLFFVKALFSRRVFV